MIRKPIILIADDEQNIRLLVKRYLNNKYAVLEAKDGREAIEMTRKHKPMLILMDIMMPNMDGYEASSVIKKDQSTKSIPIVMVTALGYQLNKELAAGTGTDGYITKPFSSEELLETIRKFVAET